MRTFLSSHFASSVKRVFIWLDLPDKTVVPDVFISAFAEELKAAAAWEHVLFVVLPPPYAELRLTLFEVFMEHFNKVSPTLKNVVSLPKMLCGRHVSKCELLNRSFSSGSMTVSAGTATASLAHSVLTSSLSTTHPSTRRAPLAARELQPPSSSCRIYADGSPSSRRMLAIAAKTLVR